MTKQHLSKERKHKDLADESGSTTTTYSIRLNDQEKALLNQATELKGWTATHLIRKAALDKAAHVVNTSRPTQFDFESHARLLAKQLCEPRIMAIPKDDPNFHAYEVTAREFEEMGGEIRDFEFTTDLNSSQAIAALRDSVRLGGTEFLIALIRECERLTRATHALPAVIDPEQVS